MSLFSLRTPPLTLILIGVIAQLKDMGGGGGGELKDAWDLNAL